MKRLVLMAVIAVAAATARSSVLYWQVQDATDNVTGETIAFNYVKISADGEDLYFYGYDGRKFGTMMDSAWEDEDNPYASSTSELISGEFNDSVKSFLVELYDADDVTLAWQVYEASSLTDHIFADASKIGGTGTQTHPAVFSSMIPEPSSGLLMLFGLAALALRRRCAKVIASVAVAAAVLSPTLAFGVGAHKILLKFNATDPGCYADENTVLCGESYALVWSDDNVTPNFFANGTVVGGKIIATLKVQERKGNRFCKGNFEIDCDTYETELSKGTWAIYLLDTRRWEEDGSITLFNPTNAVNAVSDAYLVGEVDLSTVPSGTTVILPEIKGETARITGTPTDTTGAPEPVITGITVKDGQVVVSATNTASYIQYALKSGDDPTSVKTAVGNPHSGVSETDKEVVFTAPASEGATFFKITRK